MIAFIGWVVFLLSIILALPIVNFVENRGRRRLADDSMGVSGDEIDDGYLIDDVAAGGDDAFNAEQDAIAAKGSGGFGGDDDFAAFEDDFK